MGWRSAELQFGVIDDDLELSSLLNMAGELLLVLLFGEGQRMCLGAVRNGAIDQLDVLDAHVRIPVPLNQRVLLVVSGLRRRGFSR